MLIALAIIAVYWIFDVLTEGQMTNRPLITISIFAYGFSRSF